MISRSLGIVGLVIENLYQRYRRSRVDDDERHGKIDAVFTECGTAQVK